MLRWLVRRDESSLPLIYVHVCVFVCTDVSPGVFVYTCVCTCVFVRTSMCTYLHVCMFTCVYVCTRDMGMYRVRVYVCRTYLYIDTLRTCGCIRVSVYVCTRMWVYVPSLQGLSVLQRICVLYPNRGRVSQRILMNQLSETSVSVKEIETCVRTVVQRKE